MRATRLELGIGNRRIYKREDADLNIAIDFYAGYDPDIVWDLACGLPWGQSARGVTIDRNTFDDVYAEHVLEHIGRPITLAESMEKGLWKLLADIYDCLKVGGTLRGAVPSFPDSTAILDPTHVVYFRPETFNYFGYHDQVNGVTVGWVPGFTPEDNRVFIPREILDHGNQIGFILEKGK